MRNLWKRRDAQHAVPDARGNPTQRNVGRVLSRHRAFSRWQFIVLDPAIDHAGEFRALIGLEAADFLQPWYDTSWLHRPDVHGGEVCAALVSGLIAPQSPSNARRETLWSYMQGGPGVFKGDLYFYRVDGDPRGRVDRIDTSVCPLYLLTGDKFGRIRRPPAKASKPQLVMCAVCSEWLNMAFRESLISVGEFAVQK